MNLDPETRSRADKLVLAGRCPRSLFNFPVNPDSTDPRADAHASEFARNLVNQAMQVDPAELFLIAFPGSEFIDDPNGFPDDISDQS